MPRPENKKELLHKISLKMHYKLLVHLFLPVSEHGLQVSFLNKAFNILINNVTFKKRST